MTTSGVLSRRNPRQGNLDGHGGVIGVDQLRLGGIKFGRLRGRRKVCEVDPRPTGADFADSLCAPQSPRTLRSASGVREEASYIPRASYDGIASKAAIALCSRPASPRSEGVL
jgi:hypothetical protein